MKYIRSFIFLGVFALLFSFSAFAQGTGTLTGQVEDSFGNVIVGATVTAIDGEGKEKNTTTNNQGTYRINGLSPGNYIVRVFAEGFAFFEAAEVDVKAGQTENLKAKLEIQAVEEQVQVNDGDEVSTDPSNNLSATVLREEDLAALPDDPDDLEAALQALAGPSAGPNGGQIYIDGFEGGQLPPKEAIREIRINQNPFSAEFDRLGYGRIEILTKPGSSKFRGQVFFDFNDESLNSRNPFSENRASSQRRDYGGNISGPIKKGKSSFFLDISNRENDDTEVVNAVVFDNNFNLVPFNQDFTIPSRRFRLSPRFDYAINENNTLVARYSFNRSTSENQGIGEFSLPSRAFSNSFTEHEIQMTETMIINSKTVNETRFEFEAEKREQTGDNTIPTINVSSAFIGGGAQIGQNFTDQKGIELQNYTTTAFGKNNEHSVKFGARLRHNWLEDRSESNYGGTFVFAGFINDNGTPNNPADDTFVTPTEQYRQKLLGNADPRYNPNQFSLTAGNPLAEVSQTDVGLFITDDWKVNPGLTLSLGLRYENQTNISDNSDFAPRLSFAYAPGAGGARAPKTVFRGGIGIFYDRIDDGLTLSENRFDGSQQFNYILDGDTPEELALLSQPVFGLNGVTNVPTANQLGNISPLSNTIRLLAPDLQSPYTIQTVFSVERQLPKRMTLSLSYIGARTIHQLRARNINAPVCPTFEDCENAPRPNPGLGNVYQYESSGFSNQKQLIVSFRSFMNQNFVLFGNYRLGRSESDTDGAFTFPSYSYDLEGEFSRSSFDIKHFFIMGGSFGVPYGFRISPFVIAHSGRPFNITTGRDDNLDSIFNERPTYSQLAERCGDLGLTNTFCDVSGVGDLDQVIPRNYGEGPKSFSVNLRLNKTIGFGKTPDRQQSSAEGGDAGGGRIAGVRGGRGGGRRGGFGGGSERSPYNLTLGVSFRNLFNTVNLSNPIGNLSSSRFGQSVSSAGGFGGFRGGGGSSANRRVDLQARFSF